MLERNVINMHVQCLFYHTRTMHSFLGSLIDHRNMRGWYFIISPNIFLNYDIVYKTGYPLDGHFSTSTCLLLARWKMKSHFELECNEHSALKNEYYVLFLYLWRKEHIMFCSWKWDTVCTKNSLCNVTHLAWEMIKKTIFKLYSMC